ncbi:hypothetical protein BT69DRAFT_1344968 [Atractiella rhizophila]|nr:hypothetical protein BT69DRAFT_1344968 [Atractiella rhizophila]
MAERAEGDVPAEANPSLGTSSDMISRLAVMSEQKAQMDEALKFQYYRGLFSSQASAVYSK